MIGIINLKKTKNPTRIEDVYENEDTSKSFQKHASEMLKYESFSIEELIEMFEAEVWVNLYP